MFKLMSVPNDITAGEKSSFVIKYIHEGVILEKGAMLRIAYREKDGAGKLQTKDRDAPNYLCLHTEAGAKLTVDDSTIRRYRSITHFLGTGMSDLLVFSIEIKEGSLLPKDIIDISLNNFIVGNFADSPLEFFFHLDPANDFSPKLLHPNAPRYKQFISADGSSYPDWKSTGIKLALKPGKAACADLSLSTYVSSGIETMMRVVIYDKFGNHLSNYKDKIELLNSDGIKFNPAAFDTGDKAYASVPLIFEKEGIFAGLKFKIKNLGTFIANPVKVENNPARKLFWGEMHGHSSLSDGDCRGADFFFEYARNIRGLDFAALADHAFGLTVKGHWDKLKQAIADYNVPGEFITILGYEIMNSRDRKPSGLGHRNLYFPDNRGLLVMADYQPGSGGSFVGENIEAYKGIWDQKVPRAATIEDFFEKMQGVEFLWTAHHCGNVDDVEKDRLDLYEACSEWGRSDDVQDKNNSTMTVQDIFKAGNNPGLFGNSDDHSAKAGAKKTATPDSCIRYPSGLSAVFSTALDRESVYKSLKQKQCYATTGARILIIPEASRSESCLKIKLIIAGTDKLDKIEVFKNGELVEEYNAVSGFVTEFSLEDTAFFPEDNCYIRVFQHDGEIAWINPLYFQEIIAIKK
jgi:hypothetical protein